VSKIGGPALTDLSQEEVRSLAQKVGARIWERRDKLGVLGLKFASISISLAAGRLERRVTTVRTIGELDDFGTHNVAGMGVSAEHEAKESVIAPNSERLQVARERALSLSKKS
jgi:hypothetical protein